MGFQELAPRRGDRGAPALGEALRAIERLSRVDRKTVGRYVEVGREAGTVYPICRRSRALYYLKSSALWRPQC
jgi:hypothetical protein